ncbi:hypothetical protein F5Y10DRAFT_246607 [Nemania abortiva]|nr:hypothetical protein F5Y10DRAFT_246607 [Nemania abortiva]
MSTNLGPLPTDFTIAANCADELDVIYKVHSSTVYTGDYFLLQGPLEQTTCYPNGYAGNTEQYYSPARCPTGFTAPCQSSNVAGTVTETVLTCCPTQANFVCQTTFKYPWNSGLGCNSLVGGSGTTWTVSEVSDGVTSLVTSTFGSTDGLNAYSIQVRYQSTDFISTPTPTTTTPQNAPSTSTSQTQSVETSPTTSSDQSNISGGTIAGIVVGVIATILVIVALITAPRLIRRRQAAKDRQPIQQYIDPYNARPELHGNPVSELDSRAILTTRQT